MKEANRVKTHKVQFSTKERVTLAMYFMASVKPENRAERKRWQNLFEELALDDLADRIETEKGIPLTEAHSSDTAVYTMTGDALDYLFEKLNAATAGTATLTVARIERRLEDVKAGVQNGTIQAEMPSENESVEAQ